MADRVLSEFQHAIELLCESPGMGHVRSDLTLRQVRFWPVYDYLIIYSDQFPLEVVRILNGFRDIFEILRRD